MASEASRETATTAYVYAHRFALEGGGKVEGQRNEVGGGSVEACRAPAAGLQLALAPNAPTHLPVDRRHTSPLLVCSQELRRAGGQGAGVHRCERAASTWRHPRPSPSVSRRHTWVPT